MGEMHAEPSTAATRAVQRDDDAAWFDDVYPHLHRMACVTAPPDIDPHDLVQDALVRYLQLDDRDSVRSPRAFLTATIVNLASNHRRSWTRGRAAFARLGRTEPARNEYPSDLDDLDLLPPREQAVLYLHYVDGLPFAAVAELLGCSAAAARKAAERGRRHLADVIEEDDQ